MLGIVGCNDRALSLALVAKKEGLDVTIIGKYEETPALPNEVLRQSVNWDLVSFLSRPRFDQWRMDKFLKSNRNYNSQSDLEAPPFIKRDTWNDYIKDVQVQLTQMGVVFREEDLVSFSANHAVLKPGNEKILYDQVCIAESPKSLPEPLYIDQEDYNKLSPMLWTHPCKLNLLVLPTGNEDYAMKAAIYLQGMGHTVTYLLDEHRECKYSDYEVPSFKEWGYKTSLGSFYREFLKDKPSRDSYMRKVDSSYSVMRSTMYDFRRSGCRLLRYGSLNSLNAIKAAIRLEQFDYFIDLRKKEVDIALLKPNDALIADPSNPRFALVTEGMRCPRGNVYVTGELAEVFDGPRQRYILSAGITSKEIVTGIRERSKHG